MVYYIDKTLSGTSFYDAIDLVTEALKEEGFGIITEIDVKETFKKKIDIDFKRYTILGACNPKFAYEALQVEDKTIAQFQKCPFLPPSIGGTLGLNFNPPEADKSSKY